MLDFFGDIAVGLSSISTNTGIGITIAGVLGAGVSNINTFHAGLPPLPQTFLKCILGMAIGITSSFLTGTQIVSNEVDTLLGSLSITACGLGTTVNIVTLLTQWFDLRNSQFITKPKPVKWINN